MTRGWLFPRTFFYPCVNYFPRFNPHHSLLIIRIKTVLAQAMLNCRIQGSAEDSGLCGVTQVVVMVC